METTLQVAFTLAASLWHVPKFYFSFSSRPKKFSWIFFQLCNTMRSNPCKVMLLWLQLCGKTLRLTLVKVQYHNEAQKEAPTPVGRCFDWWPKTIKSLFHFVSRRISEATCPDRQTFNARPHMNSPRQRLQSLHQRCDKLRCLAMPCSIARWFVLLLWEV